MIRFQKKCRDPYGWRERAFALLLCLAVFTAFFPISASATDIQEKRFQDIVQFVSITLHKNAEGKPGEVIRDNALLGKDSKMVLQYTYNMTPENIQDTEADVNYYLEISAHLVLPDLGADGKDLTIDLKEEGKDPIPFAKLFADGQKAWIRFLPDSKGKGTVLSEVLSEFGDELRGAYFYLECGRAAEPPENEPPAGQACNRYVMNFENGEKLIFGYEEDEPVWSKADIKKTNQGVQNKKITWTIAYTPWQNPKAEDGVSLHTPFELRDTIDGTKHRFVEGSVMVDGTPMTVVTSRNDLQQEDAYILVETAEDASQTLSFGGTRFAAGQATNQNKAKPLMITYETEIADELLLPGSSSAPMIQNQARLYAQNGDNFQPLNIAGSSTASVPKPTWLKKEGTTTRHSDGTGSETDWKVTFFPNGFDFQEEHHLTLHDVLPKGSTLEQTSVTVGAGQSVQLDVQGQEFTVSGITASGSLPVTITYKTTVQEETYENGDDLGKNQAWFTFAYDEKDDYQTPKAETPVGSGSGGDNQTSSTATLVKKSHGYIASDRSISWTAVVNPCKADFKKGTFVDDLKFNSKACSLGHSGGMELQDGVNGVAVKIDGANAGNTGLVTLKYEDNKLIAEVGEIGRSTVTLNYTTKISDPCVFAANTKKVPFRNVIASDNMRIGTSDTDRSAQASATADVSASVLKKKAPVYDYADKGMAWTVEVNESGLPMDQVELTDVLPEGLHYRQGSLKIDGVVSPAAVHVTENQEMRQEMKIALGKVGQKTTLTFVTEADPDIFNNDSGSVEVTNKIGMTGTADGIAFQEVSDTVSKSFTNHGLVKSS